jgi:hypothetical protein
MRGSILVAFGYIRPILIEFYTLYTHLLVGIPAVEESWFKGAPFRDFSLVYSIEFYPPLGVKRQRYKYEYCTS